MSYLSYITASAKALNKNIATIALMTNRILNDEVFEISIAGEPFFLTYTIMMRSDGKKLHAFRLVHELPVA